MTVSGQLSVVSSQLSVTRSVLILYLLTLTTDN